MDINPIFLFAAFVAAVAIYIVVREKINLRKAADGEDMERLRRAVARALPEESGYQVAYGHYEKVEYVVRKRITTYYCYAIAFHESRIWVIPLRFDKENIFPGKPVLIGSDTLGAADVSTANDKKGRLRRVRFALYDKNGEALFNCIVEVNNTREDRYHHMNIIQEEACCQFARVIGSIAARINQDHTGLPEQIHTEEASMRKAYILGGLSAFMSVIFPPIGLFLSILGLRSAKKGRAGTDRICVLTLCYIGLVISMLLTLLAGGALVHRLLA